MDPSDLREALDALPDHNFKLGEMNDPSEVLSAIYECLAKPKQLTRQLDEKRCVVGCGCGRVWITVLRCGVKPVNWMRKGEWWRVIWCG